MANPTKRDKVVLALQKEVATKRTALNAIAKFKPLTNLVLRINGTTLNLNVLSKDDILLAIAQLVSVTTNLKAVGIQDVPELGGYSVDDWVHDLKGKYAVLNKRQEESKLASLETQLEGLLSVDLKADKEIDAIAKMLRD